MKEPIKVNIDLRLDRAPQPPAQPRGTVANQRSQRTETHPDYYNRPGPPQIIFADISTRLLTQNRIKDPDNPTSHDDAALAGFLGRATIGCQQPSDRGGDVFGVDGPDTPTPESVADANWAIFYYLSLGTGG